MVRLNPLLAQTVRIQETAKTLVCSELGTRYRALSAEATTAFGLSPSLIIHDELGRVRGPRGRRCMRPWRPRSAPRKPR